MLIQRYFLLYNGLLLMMSCHMASMTAVDIVSLEQFRLQYVQPLAAYSALNCTISACEALKLISQMFVLLETTIMALKRSTEQQEQLAKINNEQNAAQTLAALGIDFALNKQVRTIESRLRSVEQPVWRLASGSQLEWNHCTSGVCRCNPDTKRFTCWNANLRSVPVTQVIPMNMVSIDLSRNFLSTLHKDTFHGLTLLQELDLSNNLLDFLPFDIFQDLDSLVQLRIQSNRLEELDQRIFWKLRNLNLLDFSKNHINILSGSIFNHAQRLIVIKISDNKIKEFPPDLLADQLVLEELDMSRNEITTLQTGNVKFSHNLKELDFSWNFIETISENFFLGLKNLRTLLLHNNQLTSISNYLFAKLSKLQILDLTMNRLYKIDDHAFEELVNLRELYLGQNQLSFISDGLFLNTPAVIRLTLFSNNLTTLEEHDFIGLINLQHLMLNNNILKYFDALTFAPLNNLQKLRIDSNKLQYLPHGALHGLDKLVAVKLDKNPWHCDCRALYLARWIREFTSKLWDGQPMCRGPGNLGGHEVGLLRYDDLCDGQWASMLSLSPRLPVRKNRISSPMNYSDYFNLYLKHIYSSTSTLSPVALGTVPRAASKTHT